MPTERSIDENLENQSAGQPGEVTEEVIRERAYSLWEQAGGPEGDADDFWHKAQTQILGVE
jgi:Protein of unknown function (DUF2934)